MLSKTSNSFFYTHKVAYFVQKQVILIRSYPTLLTLYRRPNPIKIWPTYAVPPTTTLYPRSTYDLWRAGLSPTIFQPVEKLIPLTTTSQSGPDQPRCILDQHTLSPIKARSLPIRLFFQSGSWSALWCELPLINSTPTYLRCIADPNPITIWLTYAVPPTTTLYPRSTYDLWRAGSSPTIFQPVEKLIPLTMTSQRGPDQPPLYFRPTYALPDQGPLIADPPIFPERERAWVDRLSGVNGPLINSTRPIYAVSPTEPDQNMTNLRCIADHHAVLPLNIRPVESGIIPDHFSTGWKTYPAHHDLSEWARPAPAVF